MEPICKLKEIYKILYAYEKEFSEQNNITINEAALLCCLKDGEAKSANDLCDYVGLSNSRVSRIINTVEEKGYIAREMGSEDKRQMIFTLTEAGKEKTGEMKRKAIDLESLSNRIVGIVSEP
jgi:DNA-binding MarR family transcriptional regulator